MALECTTVGKGDIHGKKSKETKRSRSGGGGEGTQNIPLFCEGWMEKFALGRSMFSSKGWHRRYFFLSREGLSYARSNPREVDQARVRAPPAALLEDTPADTAEKQQANLRYNLYRYKRPLTSSSAKCLIPFDKKRPIVETPMSHLRAGFRDTTLLPVYVLTNVDVAQHPEVALASRNGVNCQAAVRSPCSTSRRGAEAGEPEGAYYYYLAISFEEKRKRFLMLLRTRNVQMYLKFKFYLRLFVHEASRYSLIPVAHPLEVNKAVPTDVNKKRIRSEGDRSRGAGFVVGGTAMQMSYYRDPDPCSAEELKKVKKAVHQWDAGDFERMREPFSEFATLRRQLSMSLAECEDKVQELLNMAPDVFMERNIYSLLDTVGPRVPDEEYERGLREEDATQMDASSSRVLVSGTGDVARDPALNGTPPMTPQRRLSEAQPTGGAEKMPPSPPSGVRNGHAAAAAKRQGTACPPPPSPPLGSGARGASALHSPQPAGSRAGGQRALSSDIIFEEDADNYRSPTSEEAQARRRIYHKDSPLGHHKQNGHVEGRAKPLPSRPRGSLGDSRKNANEGSGIVKAH